LIDTSTTIEHGYYQVKNKRIINKIEAILEAEKINDFPYFIFHDDIYSTYDWAREPTETLDQLYARRAWELREKYDYLILHFSGGSDSTNILETFIKNKIPLDELFIRGPWAVADKNIDNRSAGNLFAEAWFSAWPLANWVKDNHYPNIKITVTDTTNYLMDYFKTNDTWYDNCQANSLAPGVIWKADYDLVEPRYREMSEQGLKVAHVLGMEKPQVCYENNEFHVKFLDSYCNIMLGPRCVDLQNPYFVEAFYWAPSTAEIIIKQAHVIKNYIKENRLDPATVLFKKGRESHEWLARLIYNRTLPDLFVTEKRPDMVFLVDRFFFKDHDSSHLKNYHKGMHFLNQLLPEKWKKPISSSVFDLTGIWSRKYNIGQ
jgi:hypothetical protein